MIEQLITEEFSRSGIKLRSVNVLNYEEKHFGNFVAETLSDLGKIKIIRDKGQIFLDFFNQDKDAYVPAHIKYPKLLKIFSQNSWELYELLECIKQNSS